MSVCVFVSLCVCHISLSVSVCLSFILPSILPSLSIYILALQCPRMLLEIVLIILEDSASTLGKLNYVY